MPQPFSPGSTDGRPSPRRPSPTREEPAVPPDSPSPSTPAVVPGRKAHGVRNSLPASEGFGPRGLTGTLAADPRRNSVHPQGGGMPPPPSPSQVRPQLLSPGGQNSGAAAAAWGADYAAVSASTGRQRSHPPAGGGLHGRSARQLSAPPVQTDGSGRMRTRPGQPAEYDYILTSPANGARADRRRATAPSGEIGRTPQMQRIPSGGLRETDSPRGSDAPLRPLLGRHGTHAALSRRGSMISDGWDQDYYVDQPEDHWFKPGRDYESSRTAHRYTDPERARMLKFDAIDFWAPATRILKTHFADDLATERAQRHYRWLVYTAVGVLVGVVAFFLLNSIIALTEWRRDLLDDNLRHKSGWHRWLAFLPWYGTGVAFVLGSVLLCIYCHPAAGSGVPDVMAYLNGVTLPRAFGVRTLVMKVLSCALAVGGSMPVGPEGPMIHIGAMVGAVLVMGNHQAEVPRCKSADRDEPPRTIRCPTPAVCGAFRHSPMHHREFITAGAAAGVACAFSAPVGGFLFVVEEISSFFSKRALWMSFFTCLVSIFTFNSMASNFEGFKERESAGGECTSWARWEPGNTILFRSNAVKDFNMMSIIPTVLIGGISGIVASIFTFANLKVVRWRTRVIHRNDWRRVLEPCLLFVVYGALCIICVMAMDCKLKPNVADPGLNFSLNYGNRYGTLDFFDAVCPDPEREYHPLATLVFAGPDKTVRLLMRRDPSVPWDPEDVRGFRQKDLAGARIFPYSTLAVWLLLYATFACVASGTHIASGIVIPMLTIGSILGRLMGLVFVDIMEAMLKGHCGGVDDWVDPGVFALIGAAAFFGGVSRLTFSLTVIVLELSNDLAQLPTVMLSVMIAKLVADNFTHSLYHALLEVRCVPFLDYDCTLPYLDVFSAAHLMSKVRQDTSFTIKQVTVEKVLKTLRDTDHNAFPVIGVRLKPGRFKGLVTRQQLCTVLGFMEQEYTRFLKDHDQEEAAYMAEAKAREITHEEFCAVRDLLHDSGTDQGDFIAALAAAWQPGDPIYKKELDFTHIVNTSTFTVPKNFCVSATYHLFRSMGLRHLVVTNAANQVVGIITRKDLIHQSIEERTLGRVSVQVQGVTAMQAGYNFLQETDELAGLARGQHTLVVTETPPNTVWPGAWNAQGVAKIRAGMRLVCMNRELVTTMKEVRRITRRVDSARRGDILAAGHEPLFDLDFIPHGTTAPPTKTQRVEQVLHAAPRLRRPSLAPSGPPEREGTGDRSAAALLAQNRPSSERHFTLAAARPRAYASSDRHFSISAASEYSSSSSELQDSSSDTGDDSHAEHCAEFGTLLQTHDHNPGSTMGGHRSEPQTILRHTSGGMTTGNAGTHRRVSVCDSAAGGPQRSPPGRTPIKTPRDGSADVDDGSGGGVATYQMQLGLQPAAVPTSNPSVATLTPQGIAGLTSFGLGATGRAPSETQRAVRFEDDVSEQNSRPSSH
eukprot:TRINITY_DN9083_c0_g1_i1.p1 TRINITY_DN9083_c0_g1~~TRINITY_DN9083_c0_g1_i1.p1  ORF type:complete len:1474 (+),score=353.66 TRINITY_DN9083_c0_g1_i1:75-4424(+)